MKKLICLLTLAALLLGAVCGMADMTPGTYSAEGQGNNGPVVVEVTVTDKDIVSVEVKEHAETPGICDPAMERIPAAIVDGQTLAVDTVSGATNSSNAILTAAQKALEEAGADMEALKQPVEKAESTKVEEREVEVLVIGAGGSGMAAATTLMEQGRNVLLIDKMAQAGGATSLTGALINGGMSHQQAIRGATDSVETIFMDLMKYGSFLNDARMTWIFANNTGAAVDWLHDTVGVEFEEALNYFPEHTNDRALYPLGKKAGYLTSTMEAHYKEIGGELLTETRAEHLIMEDGRVVGAECSTNDGTLIVRAKAVVLATGGYGASVALRDPSLTTVLFYGSAASTGDGIYLAQEVGAKTHYMQYLKSYPQGIEKPLEGGNITPDGTRYIANAYISPLASQAATMNDGAIYVNKGGERCMNENLDFVSIKKATMKQDGKTVYLVMNQKGYDNWMASMGTSTALTAETVEPWLDATEGAPVFRRGATLKEAAEKAGIDAAALEATVSRFNEMVKAGKDEDFGREQMSVALDDDGCWYIIEQRLRMATSLGGLKTSTSFEVYDENENVIPGLYACGEVVGGVHGDESMPSCMVGWAITSGRLTGFSVDGALAE